jgi:aryl-alcohol dehydrogenase-like predicted oxidoreductase
MYDMFDTFTDEGLIAGYGVSIETTQQALDAIAHPQLKSVQIIANAFRLKPFEQVMPAAAEAGVGIIVRVPLASGLLAAKFTAHSTFGSDDHRHYNRNGEAFDMGETFSGVPFELGINAAAELGALAPEGVTPAQAAIRWLVDQPGVTTVIPGASSVEQAQANAAVAGLAPTTAEYDEAVHRIYEADIRQHVHGRW